MRGTRSREQECYDPHGVNFVGGLANHKSLPLPVYRADDGSKALVASFKVLFPPSLGVACYARYERGMQSRRREVDGIRRRAQSFRGFRTSLAEGSSAACARALATGLLLSLSWTPLACRGLR